MLVVILDAVKFVDEMPEVPATLAVADVVVELDARDVKIELIRFIGDGILVFDLTCFCDIDLKGH